MTFKQQVTERTVCAGQDCKERKNCQRFRMRGALAEYASFDIERRRFDGPCIHRVVFVRRSS